MSAMIDTLDMAFLAISDSEGGRSDSEVALITIRASLQALIINLIKVGGTGGSLTNDGLAMVVAGLLDTVNWMDGKLIVPDNFQIPVE